VLHGDAAQGQGENEMKGLTQTEKILDQKFNIKLASDKFERWVESLDADGKRWYRTATVGEIAEVAAGVLCNTEPSRDEMARPGEWAN